MMILSCHREFKEDKSGVLDIRAHIKTEKQFDIEIQIAPTVYMNERTLYYWSRMYTSQIQSGDSYEVLKKCVTINIVDFIVTKESDFHSSYHITEDRSGN